MKISWVQTFSEHINKIWRFCVLDPRHYQITILSSLILLGISKFGFHIPWWHAVACIGSALGTQLLGDRVLRRRFDVRSPLISSLSLTLLLRTGSVSLSILAGVLAIAAKYMLRINNKHIFNPANFGIVVVALLFTGAWVSPGQWGTAPLLALWFAGLGVLVTTKAKSLDLTGAFLGFYAGLVFGRALWLGDPMTIPLHQMQSGALLLFAFFMISDPKTTPNARAGRIAYTATVAFIGFVLQFAFYQSAGVIYALVLTAPLVPLFDKIFPAQAYQWPSFPKSISNPKGGVSHDENIKILAE